MPHFGGSFAPPLTPGKLDEYKVVIEKNKSRYPEACDIMSKLVKMVEVFQQTPESKNQGHPHPSGTGTIVHLEDAEIKRIDEYVPFKKECDYYSKVFQGVEADVSARNSQRIIDWQAAVRNAVIAKHFPDLLLWQKILAALATMGSWVGLMNPDMEKQTAEWTKKRDAVSEEVHTALRAKSHPSIPYPKLEPTPVRGAATHLLWFAKELTADREPLTNNRLPKK